MAIPEDLHEPKPPQPDSDLPNSRGWWLSDAAPFHLAAAGVIVFWAPWWLSEIGIYIYDWSMFCSLAGTIIGMIAFLSSWTDFDSPWSWAAAVVFVASPIFAFMSFIQGLGNL